MKEKKKSKKVSKVPTWTRLTDKLGGEAHRNWWIGRIGLDRSGVAMFCSRGTYTVEVKLHHDCVLWKKVQAALAAKRIATAWRNREKSSVSQWPFSTFTEAYAKVNTLMKPVRSAVAGVKQREKEGGDD